MSIRERIANLLGRFTDIPNSCLECGKNFIDEDRLRMHREIENGSEFVIYRCTDCGIIRQSLATLHAHAEGHRSFLSSVIDGGNAQALMEYTEKLKVVKYEEIDPMDHLRGESLQ